MDKLTLFKQLVDLEVTFENKMIEYLDFHLESVSEISEFKSKILFSIIKSKMKNGDKDLEQYGKWNYKKFEREVVAPTPSYSRYNSFVWLRICSRKIKEMQLKERQYHEYFQQVLYGIKFIENNLSNMKLQKRELEWLKRFSTIKYKIRELLEFNIDEKKDLANYLRHAFTGDWKMDKNNFLSLITVNKSLYYSDGTTNEIRQRVKELPDEMDFKTFYKTVVLMDELEHEQDCYLFDVCTDDFYRMVDTNKELRNRAFGKIEDTVRFTPTQSSQTIFEKLSRLDYK